MHGAGVRGHGSGRVYDGMWCRGERVGFGAYFLKSGKIMLGEQKEGRWEGHVVRFESDKI